MTPKYKIIYNDFKNKILNEELKEGDRIPDEFTLCDQYGCARMTVKKGLDLLANEGLIYRKQGQGSFVLNARHPSNKINIQERELTGFTGSVGSPVESRTLSFQMVFASAKVSRILNLKPRETVYEIKRIRYLDGEPCVFETTYMPPALIPNLTQEVLDHSIYKYIEESLHLRIASAKKTTYADRSSETDQKELNLKPDEPVLVVEQTAYLDNGVPFEYSITHHRYDRFRFDTYSIHH